MFNQERINAAEKQIEEEKKIVDYDTKEYPVEVIVAKYVTKMEDDDNELFIPDYQRDFVWSEKRQSKFIESVILGLPIPYVFVADNEGRIEVVDGSQRIRTLVAFVRGQLILTDLKKLTELNDFKFSDLSEKERRRFNRKTIRMIELTENANEDVRRDIFERINTGSDELSEMEKRKGILAGSFYKVVSDCSNNPMFKKLCPISDKKIKREEGPEMVLRFFAYAYNYESFEHSVVDFLTDFMTEMNEKTDFAPYINDFETMLTFAERLLKNGFRRTASASTTPRVRFETLSVGIHLALKQNPELTLPNDLTWLDSDEMAEFTRSDASNSKPKVKARIEFVRDKLLGG